MNVSVQTLQKNPNNLILTASLLQYNNFGKWRLICCASKISHLLSLPQTQKANSETFELQKDVIDSRVGVAGQQHAETACMQDSNLGRKVTFGLTASIKY